MQEIARVHGGSCLSKEYINGLHEIEWSCAKSHQWRERPTIALRSSWCPICRRRKTRRRTIQEIQQLAARKGGRCLSRTYRNGKEPLKWQCASNHTWKALVGDIQQGHWCPFCYGNNVGDIVTLQKIAKERGGRCLSAVYVNRNTHLEWECSNGHRWGAVPNHIVQGRWCPLCSAGTGETHARLLIEVILQADFPKKRPPWLVNKNGNRLELDGYSQSLGAAFEYQGEQHYRKNRLFHESETDFTSQVNRDQIKAAACHQNGVKLIVVPYSINGKDLAGYIVRQCRKLKISVKRGWRERCKAITGGYISGELETLRKIAAGKGGELLSKEYWGAHTKIRLKCKLGHEWTTKAYKISQGTWCSACAGNQRRTISDMQALAQANKGACLSDQYVNAFTKLKWRCAFGHEWLAKPNSIQQGKWCRKCFYERRDLESV
jgi:hypothetical protein